MDLGNNPRIQTLHRFEEIPTYSTIRKAAAPMIGGVSWPLARITTSIRPRHAQATTKTIVNINIAMNQRSEPETGVSVTSIAAGKKAS
ncbi:MAG: hypothetical protein GDA50_08600 [Alphaproteobacteria bacterium GM202ARS2]|nr:hypothetical protein [Alphaproteobacteria bacterium GM202ARS2]